MNYAKLILIPSLALMLGMTGCASKKAATGTDSTAMVGNGSANGSTGASTTGMGVDGGLNGQNMDGSNGTAGANGAMDPVKQALSSRVVHFDYDSSDLSQEDFATLNAHARYLAKNAAAKVLLAGHTDERGTREYNMALGERRAKAVQTFFVTNGVPSGQLDVVSYGKEMPVNEGHDEAAWSDNRRVEIKYEAGEP